MILDPPAFVKRKKDMPKAQAAYRKLNQLASAAPVDRDGMLVSCSCSYHISGRRAADCHPDGGAPHQPLRAGARGGGQSPDHPVHPAIPETRYLKAFFCRVSAGLNAPNDSVSRFDPIAFAIGPFVGFGPLKVHWYGIMYLVAFAAGWWLGRLRAAKPGSTWKPADVDDFMFFARSA